MKNFPSKRESRAGFDVIKGSKGWSARYGPEPLLWLFPNRFLIAPQGKGNAHAREVRELRDRHFPELAGTKSSAIHFDSEHFTLDRFRAFVTDVQEMMRADS